MLITAQLPDQLKGNIKSKNETARQKKKVGQGRKMKPG